MSQILLADDFHIIVMDVAGHQNFEFLFYLLNLFFVAVGDENIHGSFEVRSGIAHLQTDVHCSE